MRQHEMDPLSLFFGLMFLFVSGSYLLSHATDMRMHWLLAVPAGLIAAGVVVLATVVRRIRRSEGSVLDDDHASMSTTTGA